MCREGAVFIFYLVYRKILEFKYVIWGFKEEIDNIWLDNRRWNRLVLRVILVRGGSNRGRGFNLLCLFVLFL